MVYLVWHTQKSSVFHLQLADESDSIIGCKILLKRMIRDITKMRPY